MNTRLIVLLSLASASLCAVLVSACGGSDNTTGDGGDDATTNGDTSNDTNVNPDTSANDTGTNDTGTNDTGASGPCADAGFGCRQCCVGLYPDAAAILLANEETCACTTPGDCATACASSLCQAKAPNNQCSACLRNADAGNCGVSGIAACETDPQCKPLADCEIGCPAPSFDAGGGPG